MKTFVNVGAWVRDSFFSPATRERLEKLGEVAYCEGNALGGDELRRAVRGFDVVMTGWAQPTVHAADIPGVRMVLHTGGTVGGIVDPDVFDAGIPVLSGNRYYAESVAEGVIAYMLFALRDMGYYSSELKAGRWQPTHNEGLLDQTVGIISLGAISRLVIERLRTFRCRIKVFSTRPDPAYAAETGVTFASIDEIFASCRIVSLHTARTPQTIGMIGKKQFDLLRDGAIFINTARGEIVDEQAMLDALATGRFRAVLDVYHREPLPADDPLLRFPNVILFPHQCGPTYDRRDAITNFLIDDAEAYFAGRPVQNEITKEVAARMTR